MFNEIFKKIYILYIYIYGSGHKPSNVSGLLVYMIYLEQFMNKDAMGAPHMGEFVFIFSVHLFSKIVYSVSLYGVSFAQTLAQSYF